MLSHDLINRYFDAWNRHSANDLAALYAADGTYEDPTAGRLNPTEAAAFMLSLVDAFPDLRIEVGRSQAADDRWISEWHMTGTNTGAFAGAPPTGQKVRLPGIDVFSGTGERITSVVGYFNESTLIKQLGLQVVVQPHQAGPYEFGRATRVRSGEDADLGAVSLTWIDVDSDADQQKVIDYSRMLAAEMAEMPGCLGWVGVSVGRRLYTLTGWRDTEAAAQLRRMDTHRGAVQEFFQQPLGQALHTGVWVPHHLNATWRRCETCGTLTRGRTAKACTCGARWPEPARAF